MFALALGIVASLLGAFFFGFAILFLIQGHVQAALGGFVVAAVFGMMLWALWVSKARPPVLSSVDRIHKPFALIRDVLRAYPGAAGKVGAGLMILILLLGLVGWLVR
ncbi:hypothetical protein [Caenimonas aquaedulcis]|uniref:Uncharacterized protein n=1 Tax=Caenimonas aquaedulcis TaxID=2793270 RepID=A0A931H912_9BURK|nr:hypothetical protein [Caenimonas aquaedulcis]MBG9390612.1 hypothetical protein [Caenimonas aquaedulcis]